MMTSKTHYFALCLVVLGSSPALTYDQTPPPATVAERIEKEWGRTTLLLFEGLVSETVGIGQEATALWSVWWQEGELVAFRNNEALFNWQVRDEGWRLTFTGETVLETGNGKMILQPVRGTVMLGSNSCLLADLGNQRFTAVYNSDTGETSTYPGRTCRCFGKGNQTKNCSQDDCDFGEKCGADRACRWTSPHSEE